MDIISRIVSWQKERLLHKQEFSLEVEATNILEELGEAFGLGEVSRFFGSETIATIEDLYITKKVPKEMMVDAFCDIIVFSVGAILKLGYSPKLAMEETLKEIDSRVGTIVNGKFTKDKSPEAKANWYQADYTKATLDNEILQELGYAKDYTKPDTVVRTDKSL